MALECNYVLAHWGSTFITRTVQMGKIMLWTGKNFYNYIEVVCVTCLNILKMGVWTEKSTV